MTVVVSTGVDMTGSAVKNVPDLYPYVFGYCSGLDFVPWSPGDWAKYSGRRVCRTYQGAGTFPGIDGFDEIDVESGAVTPQQAADLIHERVNAGHQWTTVYGSDGALQAVSTIVQAMGEAVWNGHVNCRLADWNLNAVEAAAKVGSFIHGMSCVAVQWASPESNPNTLLPGTNLTLAQANADLNMVDSQWVPGGGFTPINPPPPPPPNQQVNAIAVILPGGVTKHITSTDSGNTWH